MLGLGFEQEHGVMFSSGIGSMGRSRLRQGARMNAVLRLAHTSATLEI